MRKLYPVCLLTIFLFALSYPAIAEEKRDYIITIDKKKITGEVKDVYYAHWGSRLTFQNEWGTEYKIHPGIIRGFVYYDENGTEYRYESKYHKRKWVFYRVLFKGDGLFLYSSTETKKMYGSMFQGYKVVDRTAEEYLLEFYDEKIFQLYPHNYKKVLKKKLSKFPQIAEKIGSPGYKLKDIMKIVKEYNDLYDLMEKAKET